MMKMHFTNKLLLLSTKKKEKVKLLEQKLAQSKLNVAPFSSAQLNEMVTPFLSTVQMVRSGSKAFRDFNKSYDKQDVYDSSNTYANRYEPYDSSRYGCLKDPYNYPHTYDSYQCRSESYDFKRLYGNIVNYFLLNKIVFFRSNDEV